MGTGPDTIAAEVEPAPGRAREAARRVQELGLRVLYVGATISVDGPREVWESVLGVSFRRYPKQAMKGVRGTEVGYYRPESDDVTIPAELRDVVAAVVFMEPPELH